MDFHFILTIHIALLWPLLTGMDSPCHPLWYNECMQNSDCCSDNCHRNDPSWKQGVCKPSEETTTTTTTVPPCHPLWYNECMQNSDCCSGNCHRNDPSWKQGVCQPLEQTTTTTTTTVAPCQPLWYNQCVKNSDCCSANCSRSDPTWQNGVCSPAATETTTPPPEQSGGNTTTGTIDEQIESYIISNSVKKQDTVRYTKYVKGLLFSANNFQLIPDPLACTDLDPEKKFAIELNQTKNEGPRLGIRICDLCPYLPLEKMTNIQFEPSDRSSVIKTQDGSNYVECISQCVGEPNCLALTFNSESHKCLHFSSTRGELSEKSGFVYVTIDQPTWTLRNWILSRNTRISVVQNNSTNSSETSAEQNVDNVISTLISMEFLDCLAECEKKPTNSRSECSHVSYNQQLRECTLFSEDVGAHNPSIQYLIDYEYGYLSSFRINSVYSARTQESWRFQETSLYIEDFGDGNSRDEANFNLTSDSKKEFDYVDNAGCKLQPLEGCDSALGKQKCRYPENIVNYTNPSDVRLPICPGSRYERYKMIQEEIDTKEKCFSDCVKTRECVGIQWVKSVGRSGHVCQLITLNSLTNGPNSLSKLKDFYALRTPRPTIASNSNSSLSPLWKFELYPGYKLSISSNEVYPENWVREMPMAKTFEDCLAICENDENCERISFDIKMSKCIIAKGVAATEESNESILFVKQPAVNSPAIIFTHILETGFSPESSGRKIRQFEEQIKFEELKQNTKRCLNTCLNYMETNNQPCDFVAITQKLINRNSLTLKCEFYNDASNGTLEKQSGTEIYSKNLAIKSLQLFKQSELDKIPFFQTKDFYSCFRKSSENSFSNLQDRVYDLDDSDEETSSSNKISHSTAITTFRRKRGFWDWLKKNVFQPIGNAVKSIVNDVKDTFVKTGETIGKVFKGDFEGAKNSFLEIPIVRDIKETGESAVDLVKAIGSGENVGEKLLNFGTNLIGVAPIPGGKGVKALSKGFKPKTINKGIPKEPQGKIKPKKETKNDKEKKKEKEQAEQCERSGGKNRPKRATTGTGSTAGSKRRLNCNDDRTCIYKTRSNATGNPILIPNMDKTASSSCREIKLKQNDKQSSCNFRCKAGYSEKQLQPVCGEISKSEAKWRMEPECEPSDCGKLRADQTTNIAVKVPHPALQNKEITTYFVKYDADRKIPIWSATYHDKFNYFLPPGVRKLTRSNNFKEHPCPLLGRNRQIDVTTYKGKNPYIRGHLTPYQAIGMLGRKSGDSSFLLINIAPQETWTNSVPWGHTIEDNSYCFLKKHGPGMVITGLCPGDAKGSSNNFPKPSCFWKLVCYKNSNGDTRVVGFIAPNAAVTNKVSRRRETEKLYSQQDLINEVTKSGTIKFKFVTAWAEAGAELLKFRDIGGPTPLACSKQLTLPANFGARWTNAGPARRKRNTDNMEYFGCTKDELQEFRALISSISSNSAEDGDEDNDPDNQEGDNNGDGDGEGSEGSAQTFASRSCGKRLIGYYPSWGKAKFTYWQGKSLTHVVFAFFETFADGSVRLGSADSTVSTDPAADLNVAKQRLANFLRIVSSFGHLKSMFAVGGWENSQYFSNIASDSQKRATFIASALQIIDQYRFDGIDIDWEHPATGGAVEGIPEDKANYVTLMRELRNALDGHAAKIGRQEKFLISFAGAAGQWTLDPGLDLPKILQYADWANVMTYDYFGAWASKWGAYTGPPAPLFFGNPKGFSGKVNADWTMKYYVCKTKRPHQVNMGVPFYGRFWENVGDPIDPKDGMWRTAEKVGGVFKGGFVPWKDIKKDYLSNPEFKHEFHSEAKVPYAFNANKKIFLGYENPESLAHKVKYAEDFNLGGLMVWALDQDDEENSMLTTLLKANLCKITEDKKVVHRCPPIDEKRWWTPEDGYDKAGICGKSAPLYKGYYPVCDPDDPGYSCCGNQGYCGSGPEYCDCPTCVDYRKNPDKIIQEPTKPSQPIRWYILTDPDGKRGRCGRDAPVLPDGQVPICNPDDPNSHCCSNGGYCGAGPKFCECEGCLDFTKNPNYKYKEKTWWSWADGESKSGKCGEKAERINGKVASCDPDSKSPCCSPNGYCGKGPDFCDCKGCVNYATK